MAPRFLTILTGRNLPVAAIIFCFNRQLALRLDPGTGTRSDLLTNMVSDWGKH
jgi:hypothetical protein